MVCQYRIIEDTEELTEDHRKLMNIKNGAAVTQWQFDNPEGPYGEKQWWIDNYVNGPMRINEINMMFDKSSDTLSYFMKKYDIKFKDQDVLPLSGIMNTMNNPIKPVAFDHFFTKEEVDSIYKTVNDMMDKGVADTGDKYQYMTKLTNNGFIAILSPEPFEQSISDKFREKAAELISNPAPVGFLFARYTWDSGDAPTLLPHCDRSEKKMGLYGTVELDKTIDWDFYVEDEKFEMINNKSVWFTGTHQPHWRPDKDFAPNDYYDIIICQTHSLDDEVLLTEEDRDVMDKKATACAEKHKDLLVNGLLKQYSEDGCQ